MTLLQQANQALRDQNYGTALGLYLELLQQGSIPASVVHPSLRILQRRLQALGDPSQQAKLQQISSVLAQSAANQVRLAPNAAPTPALADQAAQARDWALAAQRWEEILREPNQALDADALVRASRALFQADNFPLANQALQQALLKAPEHPEAKRAQKDQLFYHAYSDWLMQTTEGRSDWYVADGLSERPKWQMVVDLCRPYVDKPRDAIPGHDLRQWTQAGLLWAEEHWDRQDRVRAITILRETLATVSAACPPELTSALIETIETARATPGTDLSTKSERLRQLISGLEAETLMVSEWLCLYDLLNWNGLLELGYCARQHAIQRALRQADAELADPPSLQQGARAALDQGDLERAGRYLSRLPPTVQKSTVAAELRAVHALTAGDLVSFRRHWPHPKRAVDQRFREYLRGKSVAVVGPAPTGSPDGAEIDSFDVVVRVNWRGPRSVPEPSDFGSKTSVALYNAHTVRLLSNESRLELVNGLDFCLIRRSRHDAQLLPWQSAKVRRIDEFKGLFSKSLNAIPALIFDLLLHGAERIKLFKVNLYSGERQHSRGYRGRSDCYTALQPLRGLQPVMANHDLISQLNFLRILKNKCLTTDKPLGELIDSPVSSYLKSLVSTINSSTRPDNQFLFRIRPSESGAINRVLLINFLFPDLGIGGSEKSTYFLAKGLEKLGVSTLVVSENAEEKTIQETVDGVDVIRIGRPNGFGPNIYSQSAYSRFAEQYLSRKPENIEHLIAPIIKNFKPDILNTNVFARLPPTWKVARELGVPTVHTLRSYNSICSRRMFRNGEPCTRQCFDCAFTRKAARQKSNDVDAIVGISQHILNVYLHAGWFTSVRNRAVIGNGYSIDTKPSPSACPKKPYQFGYIGRMHYTKGVELFLQAVSEIRKQNKKVSVLVAGTGEEQYVAQLHRQFAHPDTHFSGYISPAEFYEKAIFCVVPSVWYEPFGRIFIEALHHGVPVLGSCRGGGSEVIQSLEYGRVFEPNIVGIQEAMTQVMNISEEELVNMSLAALIRAQDFSDISIAQQYLNLYQQVVANRSTL